MSGRGAGSAWEEDVAALRRGLQLAGVAITAAVVTAGLVIAIGTSTPPKAEPSASIIQVTAVRSAG